jgi:hypothetical protein
MPNSAFERVRGTPATWTIAIIALTLHAHAPALAQRADSIGARLSDQLTGADTIGPHAPLKRSIQAFEVIWRRQWQTYQARKNGSFRMNERPQSPEYRRAHSLTCMQSTPGTVGGTMLMPFVRNAVVTKPDRGTICPGWLSPDQGTPADEGEAIDLALPVDVRESIRSLRENLIGQLRTALSRTPRDGWIAAQYVRFVYDQRDPERTLEAARECQTPVALCGELRGLAHFQRGDTRNAQSEFERADSLTRRDSTTNKRCYRNDELVLFNVYNRAHLRDQSCERQKLLIDNTWWLADPLWSATGNERYVAHAARRIHAALRAIKDTDERYVWSIYGAGESMRETVIRYGWPSHTFWPGFQYERALLERMHTPAPILSRPPLTTGGGRVGVAVRPPGATNAARKIFIPYLPSSTKEYLVDRVGLLPDFAAIRDPFALRPEHYSLYNPLPNDPDGWWPQEFMLLPLKLAALDSGQSMLLRRDTSHVFQLTIDDPLRALDDSATGASLAVLMGGSSARNTRRLAQLPIADDLTLRLAATLSSAPIVLSAEIQPRSEREQAMRLRFGLRPPPTLREMKASDVALSDPVFLRLPNRSMQLPLEEADIERYMAGRTEFPRSEITAIYWESYGFEPGDTVQIELRIRHDERVGNVRRIASALRIADGTIDSVSIRWTEPDGRRSTRSVVAARPVVGRTISLDLNALEPGPYVVLIEMRKGRNITARSERRFTVTSSQ